MDFSIPKRCRIAGTDLSIGLKPKLSADEGLRGQARYFSRRCFIDPDLPPGEQRRAFFHETLHQADDILKIGLSEKQVARVSVYVNEIVRQLQPEKRKEKK